MGQTARREAVKTNRSEQHGPPMPKFLFKLVNPLMKWMLNSPLHARMSDRLMVLSFVGRKTGRRYSTPVGYVRQGKDVFVFTHSAWRNNFKEPALVSMRIQGKMVKGTASLVNDPARIRQMIQALTRANGAEMAQRMGFWVANLDTASPDAVRKATQGTYFIEIKTSEGK